MSIIDIHVHHRWADPDERPDYGLARTVELARQNGIDRILALPSGAGVRGNPPETVRACNDCTLALMAEDPQFWLGAMYLSPNHPVEFLREEAVRCREAGMVAIKQSIEVNARDRRIDPIAELAAELEMPILFHAWYKMVQKYPEESDGSDIAHLARRHPQTRIIMAHLTGIGRRGVQDVADLPNVSVDTCGGWYQSEIVEYAVRYLGVDRLLYGSDYPGRDYAPQIGRIAGARLSDEDREKILRGNAQELLGL